MYGVRRLRPPRCRCTGALRNDVTPAGGADDPVVARLDVARRHLGAVVELHAPAELERVRAAVLRDRPRLREVGDDLGARLVVGIDAQQRVVVRRDADGPSRTCPSRWPSYDGGSAGTTKSSSPPYRGLSWASAVASGAKRTAGSRSRRASVEGCRSWCLLGGRSSTDARHCTWGPHPGRLQRALQSAMRRVAGSRSRRRRAPARRRWRARRRPGASLARVASRSGPRAVRRRHGRPQAGTPGADRAADFIARAFRDAGLGRAATAARSSRRSPCRRASSSAAPTSLALLGRRRARSRSAPTSRRSRSRTTARPRRRRVRRLRDHRARSRLRRLRRPRRARQDRARAHARAALAGPGEPVPETGGVSLRRAQPQARQRAPARRACGAPRHASRDHARRAARAARRQPAARASWRSP